MYDHKFYITKYNKQYFNLQQNYKIMSNVFIVDLFYF